MPTRIFLILAQKSTLAGLLGLSVSVAIGLGFIDATACDHEAIGQIALLVTSFTAIFTQPKDQEGGEVPTHSVPSAPTMPPTKRNHS